MTEVAPASARGRNAEPPKRSRLLSWISGEVDDEPAPAAVEAVPIEALLKPNQDVRREMLRLQLTAEGMVINESGEIEPSPALRAAMAAQAELAAVEAGMAAASSAAAAETVAGTVTGADMAAAEVADAPDASPVAADSPDVSADAATPDGEIRKAS